MKRFFSIILLIASAFTVGGASASPVAPAVSFGEWNVEGSNFVMNWTTGEFSSPTHVTMTRPGNSISADTLSGNEKQKTALLTGNVVIHDDRGTLTGGAPGGGGGPSTLTCDRLAVDGTTKIYTAEGNVRFVQGGRQAYADRATMNGFTHVLELHGHVRLIS